MAAILKLADISQSAGTAVNLLSTDWQLREGSWKTRTAPMRYSYTYATPYGAQGTFEQFEPVTETMDLVSTTAASEYLVRQRFRKISNALEKARQWHTDSLLTESWWLYWNCNSEDLRRSLILNGSIEILNDTGISPMLENYRALLRLTVVRHPFWEPVGSTTIQNSGMNALGGDNSWSSIDGDAPARISLSQIWSPSGGPMDKVWIGVREEYDGYSNFNPTWECEDGTNGTDASDAIDGTASDGNKVAISFSTQTSLYERMSINVYQVATANGHSSYTHFKGHYLVLCRCKVSSGTIGLEMRMGYTGSSTVTRYPMIYLENTSWQLVELGTIKIPPAGTRGNFDLNTSEISLWAERIDGSGTLDLDALVLIPSRHMVRIENAAIQSGAQGAYLIVHEDDSSSGLGYGASYTDTVLDIDPIGWYLPTDNGMVVVAGTRTAGQSLTDQLSAWFLYYPRWLAYRQDGTT